MRYRFLYILSEKSGNFVGKVGGGGVSTISESVLPPTLLDVAGEVGGGGLNTISDSVISKTLDLGGALLFLEFEV